MKPMLKHLLFLAVLLVLAVGTAQAAIDPATVQKLLASDGAEYDMFGYSVSVSGDTAIVGAYGDDDTADGAGAVYVFTRAANGKWHQQAKLTVEYGAEYELFGYSVSVSGDTAVIGSLGATYVFIRNSGVWSQQQLIASAAGGGFGQAVSVSGDTAVVGDLWDDDKGSDAGAVYVFTRTNGVWSQQQKLTAADGADKHLLGQSVSVSGDTVVIGSFEDTSWKGSTYVFTRTNGVWSQQQKLTAADGAADDRFGVSVSVSGDTAVIGAWGNDSFKGAAYVFTRTNDVWSQQQKLTAGNWFGISVSVSGDTAVVGSYDDNRWKGSAYVFTRTGGVWSQQQKLTGAADDRFGASVSVSGSTAIFGAYGDDDKGDWSGAAYIFGSAPPVTAPHINMAPIYKLLLKGRSIDAPCPSCPYPGEM